MNLLIMDLEATCYEKSPPPRFVSETIEIGAVMLDTTKLSVLTEYQCFVRPVLFPELSPFCRDLTSITQQEVNQGLSLKEAVYGLETLTWQHQSLFCSWGHYDRKQLKKECASKGVPYPFSAKHLNLKEAHSSFYGVKKMGMRGALKHLQIPLVGTHHRGIDDARNIAKIVQRMIQDGWNWLNYVESYEK
ncbi:3'-5' exonuclease [Risungbinella massiliensis]|uniref:3'-5' exonuclease n=1 Tax=Risungbinella massiliensis TaxID=1329796 RepID=UPI0005CC5921|nr:3'-5' exonuclease [Risungbinella massiliensis]